MNINPASLQSKKVLVTGAGGFIGSHLVERLLESGAHVRAFVRYNSRGDLGLMQLIDVARRSAVEVFRGDLKDSFAVRSAMQGVEIAFHLGALVAIPYSYHNPFDFVQTNVLGTSHMLQAALECGVERFVHTSTSEIYGTSVYTPMDENHPLHAQSPYAATKISADKLAESFYCSFGLPVVTVRPFNTYGPRQSTRAIIPTIIVQALVGNEISVGSTEPTRDFTFVSDTVEGFLRAALAKEAVGEVINLGSGFTISIGALVQMIGKIMGRPLKACPDPVRFRPGTSEVYSLLASSEKAKRVLRWEPQVQFETGLEKTIRWFQLNQTRYLPHEYAI